MDAQVAHATPAIPVAQAVLVPAAGTAHCPIELSDADMEELERLMPSFVGRWSGTGSFWGMKIKSEYTIHPRQHDSYRVTGTMQITMCGCLPVHSQTSDGTADARGFGHTDTDSTGGSMTSVLSAYDAKTKRATYTISGIAKDGKVTGVQVDDALAMTSTFTMYTPHGLTLCMSKER